MFVCLHGARDALPVAEYLVEVLRPQDVPQRGLGQQPGAGVGVLHVGHTHRGVTHSAGQDKTYFLGKKGKGGDIWCLKLRFVISSHACSKPLHPLRGEFI